MKLNNKGQALITFVLLMPIILLMLVIIVDIGVMGVQKRKVENTVKNTLAYSLNNSSSDEEIKDMIKKNIDYDGILIKRNDGITITLEYHFQPILGVLKKQKVKLTYRGFKTNNKINYEEG